MPSKAACSEKAHTPVRMSSSATRRGCRDIGHVKAKKALVAMKQSMGNQVSLHLLLLSEA